MELDREMVQQAYLAESQEGLVQMEEALLGLEQNPADQESLNTVFRVIHTIKGNGAALGLQSVAKFAHQVEDLLDLLRQHQLPTTPEVISLLLQCGDALRGLLPAAVQGQDTMSATHQALLLQVQHLVATADAAETPATPSLPGAQAAQTETLHPTAARSIRVGMEKLDKMLTLTGELAINQGRLKRMLQELPVEIREEYLSVQQEGETLYTELQESVMKSRLVPVGPMFRQFARTVRDIAQKNHKLARLVIEGEDVELDHTVVELLHDPLLHMLRNALDHGLESPDERRRTGKDASGTIRLSAKHLSGSILISLADDGAGFNREKIRARALSMGRIEEGQSLSDSELFQLVFEAGFSTADTVTDLSGRGVGMDVVRRNIDSLRGTIEIESENGKGSTIHIRLPLTLAIIEGFTVGVGQENYVIPLESVIECIAMPVDATAGTSGVINVRGEALPFLRLREVFEATGPAAIRENIVVVSAGSGKTGLVVDTLIGEGQAVIKSLGRLFRNLQGVAGSTVLGDGRVALILDVVSLVRSATARRSETAAA